MKHFNLIVWGLVLITAGCFLGFVAGSRQEWWRPMDDCHCSSPDYNRVNLCFSLVIMTLIGLWGAVHLFYPSKKGNEAV